MSQIAGWWLEKIIRIDILQETKNETNGYGEIHSEHFAVRLWSPAMSLYKLYIGYNMLQPWLELVVKPGFKGRNFRTGTAL